MLVLEEIIVVLGSGLGIGLLVFLFARIWPAL
jgi:hypothetical protein